jgi:hypothetical protein
MRDVWFVVPATSKAMFDISIDKAYSLAKSYQQSLSNLKEVNVPLPQVIEEKSENNVLTNIIQSMTNNDVDRLNISSTGIM